MMSLLECACFCRMLPRLFKVSHHYLSKLIQMQTDACIFEMVVVVDALLSLLLICLLPTAACFVFSDSVHFFFAH